MVVEAKVHRGRELNLVVVAAVYGHVRPVDHRLDPRLAVHEHVLRAQHGAVGEKREADRPLQAAAEFRLAEPDRLRPVLVLDEAPVNRHRGGGAVVVREVPLHAARNPRAEHADEGGLDDVLTVERLEAGRLVREVEEVSAMFRQHPDVEPVVLQRQVLVRLVDLLVVQNVLHRVRIDPALRTLIDAPRVEERSLVVAARRIRRKDNGFLIDLDLACDDCRHRDRKQTADCPFHFQFPPRRCEKSHSKTLSSENVGVHTLCPSPLYSR